MHAPDEAPIAKPLSSVVLENVSATVLGRAVSIALAGLSTVLMLRYLGESRLGAYAAIYAFVTLFSWATSFGMDFILIRDASQQPERASEILSEGVSLSMYLAGLAALVALAIHALFDYPNRAGALMIVAVVDQVLLQPLRLTQLAFLISLKQRYFALVSMSRALLLLLAVLTVIWLDAGLAGMVWAGLSVGIAEVLLTLVLARRSVTIRPTFKPSSIVWILRLCWPLGAAGAWLAVLRRSDQLLLGAIAGTTALSYYAASVRLTEVFVIVPASLAAVMLPIWSAVADDHTRVTQSFQVTIRYVVVLAGAICVAVSVGSETLAGGLLGSSLRESSASLTILVWWLIPESIRIPLVTALVVKGLQGYVLIGTAVSAIANLAANLVLIPRFAGVGAAWANVASYLFGGLIAFMVLPRSRGLAVVAARASILPAGLAIGVVMTARSTGIRGTAGAAVAMVMFVFGLFALGVLRRSDVTRIRGAVAGALPEKKAQRPIPKGGMPGERHQPPERIDPARDMPGIVSHHKTKYLFALDLIGRGRVLDIGCGVGYGSAVLEESDSLVVGIDVARDALEIARRTYAGDHVLFAQMDGECLAFDDACFDAIVCLEAIEHFNDPQRHLREVARVLKSGGLYVLSTPRPGMGGHPDENPYHRHEFTKSELEVMLQRHFGEVSILGQRRVQSSAHRALQKADMLGFRKLGYIRPLARKASKLLGTRATEDAVVEDFIIDQRGADEGSEFVCICRRLIRPPIEPPDAN